MKFFWKIFYGKYEFYILYKIHFFFNFVKKLSKKAFICILVDHWNCSSCSYFDSFMPIEKNTSKSYSSPTFCQITPPIYFVKNIKKSNQGLTSIFFCFRTICFHPTSHIISSSQYFSKCFPFFISYTLYLLELETLLVLFYFNTIC